MKLQSGMSWGRSGMSRSCSVSFEDEATRRLPCRCATGAVSAVSWPFPGANHGCSLRPRDKGVRGTLHGNGDGAVTTNANNDITATRNFHNNITRKPNGNGNTVAHGAMEHCEYPKI